ncbi:MAG: MFS transporter [Chloroflexi bacterium]|nr:MFS transporter [Chloroflexota bacterium]
MTSGITVKKPKKIFYGWWVVVASTIISAVGGGLHFYGFTALFLPVSKDLGLSRMETSIVMSLARLEGAIEGPLVGWLIDRFGARRLMLIGVLMFGAGFMAMSLMNSFIVFILLFAGLVTIGYQTGVMHSVYALSNKWFIRNRSKATGIVNASLGIGGATIVPVLGWLIVQYGWRTAVVVAGAAIFVICLPLLFIIRNLPEDKGLLPDGDEVKTEEADGKPGGDVSEYSFTVKEALQTPVFWVLGVAHILRSFVVGGIWVHMIPLLVFKGLDEQAAANAISILLFITIPVRIIFGWLGDIYPKRHLLVFCCFLGTVALVILLTLQSLWQVYLFVFIFALSYGSNPLNISIIGEYFGRKNFTTIRGAGALVYSLGIMTGPIYAGYIYDVTQSYQVAFITFIVFYTLAGIVFFFAKRPRPPATVTGYLTR